MKKQLLSIGLFAFTLLSNAQVAPLVSVHIDQPGLICAPGGCTSLHATYEDVKSTTDYSVSSILYNPSFPFGGGTIIDGTGDDRWTPQINLPFSFCFYGVNYNQILVGTNGVITFDTTDQGPNGFCAWNFSTMIPNATFPIKNAIYGVYQDNDIRTTSNGGTITNPLTQNVNYYVLDVGVNAAPNRVFVANFNELPMYQCGLSAGLQTSQIVLHETTNIIEVFINKRTACTTWNSGSGVIGLQNQAGTLATVPAGRNTGTWTATNEAWRFTPNGNSTLPVLTWYNNDVIIAGATENPYVVCPTESDHFSAAVTYTNCDATTTTVTSNWIDSLIAPMPPILQPISLSVCTTQAPYVFDISVNTPIVLNGLNPNDYEVAYYEDLTDAQNQTNNYIQQPFAYSITENRTIYMTVVDVVTSGCVYVLPFELSIIPTVTAPSGASQQNFAPGQTLADVVLTGENIIWYDDAVAGNMLPSNTVLQDNVTYYASQTVNNCESRSLNPSRFAVTAHIVLGNTSFTKNDFKVYPNPTNAIVTISGNTDINTIAVYNALGQQIKSQSFNGKEVKIDMSQLAAGIYFLKVNASNQMIKIIKD